MADWIDVNLPWSRPYVYGHPARNQFCQHSAHRPGVQIEVESGGTLERYLIGDINLAGGVCEDCLAFPNDAVVLRYRELIAADVLKEKP